MFWIITVIINKYENISGNDVLLIFSINFLRNDLSYIEELSLQKKRFVLVKIRF